MHNITGVITKASYVRQICSEYPILRVISLEQDFSFFPLVDKTLDELGLLNAAFLDNFRRLPNARADFLARLSSITRLLYLETEYFGGTGKQLAVVFEDGKIIYGPKKGVVGPISRGLYLLGVVKAQGDYDEFDTIGLWRYRHTYGWLGYTDK